MGVLEKISRKHFTKLSISAFLIAVIVIGVGLVVISRHNSLAAGPKVSPSSPETPADTLGETYTCPMHHQVRSDHPGECPICHMTLVPVKKAAPPEVKVVEGHAAIKPNPLQLKLSGTHTVSVERKTIVKELRVPGRALGSDRISFQIFEQDLAYVKTGMSFWAEAPMYPGERFSGRITSIESILDPMTRTARVNGTLRLRSNQQLLSESSLSGSIEIPISNVLVIPEKAVIHTGSKDLVFTTDENGEFTPRLVSLGAKAQGYYELKMGLRENEKISSGPNFLLDSESRIESGYDTSNH